MCHPRFVSYSCHFFQVTQLKDSGDLARSAQHAERPAALRHMTKPGARFALLTHVSTVYTSLDSWVAHYIKDMVERCAVTGTSDG